MDNVNMDFFDKPQQRRGSSSSKWDNQQSIGGDSDGLAMWVADADFPAPPQVVQALQQRLQLPLGYSFITTDYLASICRWLAEQHHWEVDPSWLVELPSTMAGMVLAVQTCCQPGEQLIIQPPVYAPFSRLAGKERGLLLNPLKETAEGYRFNYQQLQELLGPQTKMLALCHPHNPGGRNWSPAELRPLIQLCLEQHLVLLTDAIHCDLLFPGQHYHFPVQVEPAISPLSITIISPNKAFNIAGLSSATAIIPNPELRQNFTQLARYYHLNEIGNLALLAAEQAYRGGFPWLQQLRCYLEANQNYLIEFLQRETPLVRVLPNQATYLSWLDCRQLGQEERTAQVLNRQVKLTLNPGSSFGEEGRGFFRLNFATQKETLKQGLERFAQAYRILLS